MSVSITITSDFICPWCYIGKARLREAIADLPEGIEADLVYRPFELNPTMPVEGKDRRLYRSLKFGSWERSQALDAQTISASAGDDVDFNYAAIERTPNTFAAHRLVWFAAREHQQGEIFDRILKAYFSEGRDIGDMEVLADIASEAGIDRKAALTFLHTNEGALEVRAQINASEESGVRGVPHFRIGDNEIGGAQSVSALREAIIATHQKQLAELTF